MNADKTQKQIGSDPGYYPRSKIRVIRVPFLQAYPFASWHASAYLAAGKPASLAVTRARAARCRRRNAGRAVANSSEIVR